MPGLVRLIDELQVFGDIGYTSAVADGWFWSIRTTR